MNHNIIEENKTFFRQGPALLGAIESFLINSTHHKMQTTNLSEESIDKLAFFHQTAKRWLEAVKKYGTTNTVCDGRVGWVLPVTMKQGFLC